MTIIDVIIPAYNEEDAIGRVIGDLPWDMLREVIVVDNNSTDYTAAVASEAGATVLHQPVQGYGAACLKGIDHLSAKTAPPDIVVFLDGDYSDHPEELPRLVGAIKDGSLDMVIGSRALGDTEHGSMTPQQVFGNALATRLLGWIYGYRFTDLGPFRAIRYEALQALNMYDTNYGWTVEMQIKAARHGLRCAEVPVSYRKRIGKSKVSGTLKGSILAGYKIITTLIRYA